MRRAEKHVGPAKVIRNPSGRTTASQSQIAAKNSTSQENSTSLGAAKIVFPAT